MTERELIARVDGTSGEGAGSVLLYRFGSEIEVVVTEEQGADAVVFLSEKDAAILARALARSLEES